MEKEPESFIRDWERAKGFIMIGKSVYRIDALDKVTGRAKFVEDHLLADVLYVKLVKSPIPHGRIISIKKDAALKLDDEIWVLTASDIPGENQVGYALADQPLLAHKKVRYTGEPVALVAAKDPYLTEEAASLVEIELEELPAVYDPLEAMNDGVLIHEERGTNIAEITRVRKGNVEKGFEESEVVVENRYRTGHQEHAYLEPEGALAFPDLEGGVTVIGSIQYPHLCQRITARVLGITQSRVRIVQPYVGGGFGGKDDMGPLLCSMAALVTWKTGRPAMLVYSREDSFTSSCKRDPAIIDYRTGASKEGLLKAIDVRIVLDAGAYANRGPFVLWRATMHAGGPYVIPNAKVDGYLVYTNKVFEGSFRGFGNPQIQFAVESQLDELADELGMDPVEIRLKNVLRPGSRTLTDQFLESSVGIFDAIRLVAEKSGFREKWRKYKEAKVKKGKRRGIGIACGYHGISTSRGVPDWSNAIITVYRDGSVLIETGICEIGQGSWTAHAQIAAEVLGIPVEKVRVRGGVSDTPDTGATHASRGASIGGIGVYVAAMKIRKRLKEVASRLLECSPDEIEIRDGRACRKGNPEEPVNWEELVNVAYQMGYEMSATGYFFLPKGRFDSEKGIGYAYPAFSYIVNVAEVEVDVETGKVKVLKIWPALAAGRILNPMLVEGQVEGAIVQGLGYALMEELKFEDGKILNPNLTDYLLPTAEDIPEVEKPVYVEDLYEYGPFGAKGVGEMALIPTPAAIINAVKNASGVRIREIPATPEKVYLALKRMKADQ
ncbi:MAG TPA: aldehyde oxidase [Candidatus Korarchaeota archaeon]|nr:aldehyde oxidase [Candidatus Korarchaeota archaeon]